MNRKVLICNPTMWMMDPLHVALIDSSAFRTNGPEMQATNEFF